MIGTVIAGRYRLEAEVGRGGMGAVFRGRDEVLGRTVALKRIGLAPGGPAAPAAAGEISPDAARAEREAKLAAKLNHANVVAVFDLVAEPVSADEVQQWLVMEYVEGTDLADLVRQRGRLTPDEAAPILAQTASALAAAHSAGIVHRDVKPSNILVTPQGQVKLSDFGIARTSTDPALTQTGLVTGSPAYLSPEVASGQQATPTSDVWSWGATLFHALEGHPPYQVGDNLLGALYRIVHEEPPQSTSAGWLAPVLASTMTRDPAQRWPISRAQEYLETGPRAAVPATAPVAAPVAPRAHDADDAGTQLLPAATAEATRPAVRPAAPPSGPPATPADPEPLPPARRGGARRSGSGRRWLLVALAAVLVVALSVIAFLVGMDGDGDDPGPAADSSPSAGESSAPADGPTAEGMEEFARDYVALAVSDPESAFDLLTPAYREESRGLDGYLGFWGEVTEASIDTVSADPDDLTVSYTYTYRRSGERTTEDVTLQLVYRDGQYLISGAS